MKIVIFYKYFRLYGGQEKVVYNLSHYLAEKGYRVTVYTLKIEDKPKNKNIRIHEVWFPFKKGLRELFFAIYSYIKGKSLKKKEKNLCILGLGKTFYSDVYRADSGSHLYYFKRARLKYPNKIGKLIYVVRKHLSLSHWVNIWIEYMNFKKFACLKRIFIFPSEFTRNQVIDQFGLSKNQTTLIKNGVDLDRFKVNERFRIETRKKHNIKDNEIVFCFVSTNHKLKGLYYLLEAVKILKNKDFSFKLMVAGGNYERYFKSMIRNNKLENYVICLGRLKETEKVYNACDVFVYPTLYDAAALVVLEAMACGLVPVVSKYNGTTEIVDNGKNGFTINNPSDPEEIAYILEYIIKHKELLPVLRQNSLETIKRYPSSTVFSEIEKIIRKNCGT